MRVSSPWRSRPDTNSRKSRYFMILVIKKWFFMLDWLLQACLESAHVGSGDIFYRVSPCATHRGAPLPALAFSFGSVRRDVHDRPFAVVSDLHGPAIFPARVIINAAPARRVIKSIACRL